MADVSLREKGWFLSEEGITQCASGGKSDANSIIRNALNTDLREIGKGWLPEDINRGRADYVKGPGVLQLQKIRNVSAPKDNEESQVAPRLMKLVLTDGHITCSAVETEVLKDIGSNTAPGCKIMLKNTVGIEHGFLLLNNKNTQNLGGRVEKMAEGWELKKKLAKQQRSSYGTDGGPPPFVPFGQRIGSDVYKSSNKRDNFKSLESNKADKKTEDHEFEQQRKATIAEALLAKEDGQSKKFGGQKQVSNDFDVAKITEMGFKAEEATQALRINNGNVQQAIEYLLKAGPSFRRPQGGPNRQSNYESGDRRQGGPTNRQSSYESDRKPQGVTNRQSSYESDRGRGRRDRRDDDTGPPRGRRGRDQDDTEEVSSKPSGPATLFDFLAISNKIDTKDTKEKTSSGKDSSNKNYVENRERPRTTSGSSDQSNRSKQNVPPRFVNKPKYEQGQNRGQNHYQDDRSERSQRSREDRPNTTSDNRRYDNRSQNERSVNERDRNSNRNKNYNDRNYEDGRDYRRGGGRGDDRNFKQSDRKTSGYDSKSNGYQRQSDDRDSSRGNPRQEKDFSRETNQSSARQQKPSDNPNKSSASSGTSYSNDRVEQGCSRNYQGQRSQQSESHPNQSSANNSYKQDSYSKGGNSQKSQSSYSANSRGSNSQNLNAGSDNYVQNQQTQSSNYRNYNNYPPMTSSGGQFQPPAEYVYTEAQQPVHFNIKVGDKVMAKYWEDNLFYEAVIEVMAQNMPTVVVTFTEYGNTEEVLLTDIRTLIPQIMSQQGPVMPADMSVPPPQVFYSAPPPPVAANVDNVIQAFAGMEFRRGGGGAAYQKKDMRNQQQYYQPPPQRR